MKNAQNKIQFVAPAVADEGRSVLTKERGIKVHLNKGDHRDEFDFSSTLDLGVSNFHDTLLRFRDKHRPSFILHISAQGTEDGKIVLADDAGRPHFVSGRAVVELIKLMKDDIRAVIFDGSHTDQLGRQLHGIIDYIISMNGAVDTEAAVTFSNHFYQALSYGKSFDEAFDFGINGLMLVREADSSKPVLHKSTTRKMCAASSV